MTVAKNGHSGKRYRSPLRQEQVVELSGEPGLLLLCGRYEGIDERVSAALAHDEVSIGDYVLAGGEVAACVLIEAVTRLLPGVMGNDESAKATEALRSIYSGNTDR